MPWEFAEVLRISFFSNIFYHYVISWCECRFSTFGRFVSEIVTLLIGGAAGRALVGAAWANAPSERSWRTGTGNNHASRRSRDLAANGSDV